MADRTEHVEGFESVLKSLPEADLEQVRERAAYLVQQDVDVNAICSVMIASRQLYALARFALHRDLTAEGHEWSDGVEEFLIKAMSDRADRPFTRTNVLAALEGPTRKFMIDELEKEVEYERTEEMRLTQLMADARENRVLINSSLPGSMEPGSVLLLVGTETDMQRAVTLLKEQSQNTFPHLGEDELKELDDLVPCVSWHLSLATLPNNANRHEGQRSQAVSWHRWRAFAGSRAKMDDLFLQLAAGAEGHRCDLLIVENMQRAYESPFVKEDVSELYCWPNLSGAVKALRRWAKDDSWAVVVGGVIIPGSLEYKKQEIVAELTERYKDISGVHVAFLPLTESGNDTNSDRLHDPTA